MKFPIKDFFNKCDQIRSFLRIWSHLLKKCLMGNYIFCAVNYVATFFVSAVQELLHLTTYETSKIMICLEGTSKTNVFQLFQLAFIMKC